METQLQKKKSMSVILVDSPLCVYPEIIEVFPILIDASIWQLFEYRHKKKGRM